MKDPVLAAIITLKATAAVTTLTSTRIYKGGDIPATPTKPFIAVARVDKMPESPTGSSTYAVARIQCTSFETSETKADILSELIGDTLTQDSLLSTVVSGLEISDIEDLGSIPDSSDGKTTGEYRDNHDFKITYRLR